MKILAIRGENLASLSAIDVDFERDPLARAGLFAICGPTGAGKSTILDALCVALFDKTPRLHGGKGRVLVGHAEQSKDSRVAANDVRGLLRRGAGEGWAEVDFLGRDARRYRARWAVWRARRKPDGRLQNQVMSLTDLGSGDDLSSSKKTETLAAIETRLGLSFDQFRRSALLAQGEFAAFLRADDSERSALLERMTGTGIYGDLSRAAHERHKEERAELDEIAGQVERHAVLDDDERQRVESERTQLTDELSTIAARRERAQRAADWHLRRDQLVADERAARAALDDATRAWQAAEPQRAELDRVVRARAYRPVLAADDRAKAAVVRVAAELAQAEQTLSEIQDERDAANLRVSKLDSELDRARAAYDQARPDLARAEKLDAELLAQKRVTEQAASTWDQARRAAEQAEAERQTLDTAIAAHRAEVASAETWLRDNRALQAIAAEWPRWRSELEQYAAAAARRDQLTAQRDQLTAADRDARTALARAESAEQTAHSDLGNAQASYEKAQEIADQRPVTAVRQDLDRMSARHSALRDLADIHKAATTAAATRDRYREQARSADQRAGDAAARADQLGGQLTTASAVLGEAERTYDRLRLASDLSEHRAELSHGEPCPLCGAEEHPWGPDSDAAERAVVTGLVAEQRQRLDQLRLDHQDLKGELAEVRAEARESSARADEYRGDVAAAELALDRARITWRARQSELGELILIDEPVGDAAKAWVDTRLSAASDQLGQLRGAEKEAAELADAALIARSAVVSRTSDLTQARTERSRCGDRARSCAGQLSECQAELERTAAALVRIIDLLGAAFTGAAWSDELAADPPAFTERYRDQVDQWQQHSAARDQAHKQLESATAKHSAVAAEAERQRQRERALADEHRQQAEALAKTAAQRAELFGGRDSSAVREQLIGAIETTDQAARTARQTGQDAGERAAAAAAHRDGLSTKRNEADIEAERAAVELAAAVAESGLDLDTLRQCAAVDETWLSQQRDQLQALERARDEARVRADERTEQRVKHETGHASGPEAGSEADSEAGGIPQLDLAAARAIIAQTEEEQKAAQRRQSELEVLVRRDDEARAARAEMATQVADKERRVKLYGTLSELIGSHDGKKFRVFAQSLTLDALLAYANHHLSDLASRYHLVRVPGYDLDLQVIDRDMGDEVRGINSLSGGESFLVSLALALGLSSLAARDTRVESLLIDEGFGSLDPSTLDAALAVLDALQATGRKVGLISHVPGLAERVGVRIMVRPQGGGRSIMRVTGR